MKSASAACFFLHLLLFTFLTSAAQLRWQNVDSLYQPLPKSVQVFKTTDSLHGKPNIAFYVIADLSDKKLNFTADTSQNRRLTPQQFYQKNNRPAVVVNCTFFSFETNRNLNVVIKDKNIVAHNAKTTRNPSDTTQKLKVYNSAIGIKKNRKADIAWVKSDSNNNFVYATQLAVAPSIDVETRKFRKWKMKTAVGGGPVVVQNGEIKITNEEERMFTSTAVNDKHPRTAMGYTGDGKLIILVLQGRSPGTAEGATLLQEAKILKDLGCVEALNLDGGGSSCLLVNGKETIKPSDKEGQRAIPAVFIIK
jgi:exopolysaccharide biosynthesis protein